MRKTRPVTQSRNVDNGLNMIEENNKNNTNPLSIPSLTSPLPVYLSRGSLSASAEPKSNEEQKGIKTSEGEVRPMVEVVQGLRMCNRYLEKVTYKNTQYAKEHNMLENPYRSSVDEETKRARELNEARTVEIGQRY